MEEYYEALAALLGPMYQQSSQDVPWESFISQAYGAIDRKSGAPGNIRLAVSSARTPGGKLQALRKWYPDAVPVSDKQFLYMHNGRPTLFDEENPRVFGVPVPTGRDMLDVAPQIAEMIGGGMGAAAGAMSGGLPGAVLGAGAGGLAGREFQERTTRALYGVDDPRTVDRQASDAITTALVNAGGEGAGRAVAGGVGRVMSRYGPELQQAAGRIGVPLSAGEATGNRAVQMLERGAGAMPGGGLHLSRHADTQLGRLEEAYDFIGQRLGSAPRSGSPRSTAAGAVQAGAANAAARFTQQRRALDDAIWHTVGEDTVIPVQGAVQALQLMKAQMMQAPETLGPMLAPAVQSLEAVVADAAQNGGGIPFWVLRKARTALGQVMDSPDITGWRTAGSDDFLAAAYASLTDDVRRGAEMAGDRIAYTTAAGKRLTAAETLRLHDRYVRMARAGARDVNLDALGSLVQDKIPEQALNWALQGSRTSGDRLWALRQSYSAEEWGTLASALWYDLGQATPGQMVQNGAQFSPNTFLTGWSRMSEGAKEALFGGTRYQELRQAVDDLVRVTGSLKQAGQMRNTSNTAQTILSAGLFGALGTVATGDVVGGASTMLGSTGAPYLGARILTNPKLVRWLTETVDLANATPSSLPAQLARLELIAAEEPDIADLLYERMIGPLRRYYDARTGR